MKMNHITLRNQEFILIGFWLTDCEHINTALTRPNQYLFIYIFKATKNVVCSIQWISLKKKRTPETRIDQKTQ